MAGEQEIKALMETAMESLRQMMDVNTIIGDLLETKDGACVIPVSRVSCGFVAGGGEYGKETVDGLPFAGGSGAGVSVQPVGFLIINGQDIRLIEAKSASPLNKALDSMPLILENLQNMVDKVKDKKKDDKQDEKKEEKPETTASDK